MIRIWLTVFKWATNTHDNSLNGIRNELNCDEWFVRIPLVSMIGLSAYGVYCCGMLMNIEILGMYWLLLVGLIISTTKIQIT